MEDFKIWKVSLFNKGIQFWIPVCWIIFLTCYSVWRVHDWTLTIMMIGFTILLVIIANVLYIKTSEERVVIYLAFKQWSIDWDNIKDYSIKRSYLTIHTKDDEEVHFSVNRLLEKEEFLTLLESNIIEEN